MKIISLKAENFKRLIAAEVKPDPSGALVIIAGENGAGKTSLLDAIPALLAGGRKFKLEKPVREGAESGYAEMDVGDYHIRRDWKADGGPGTLTVTAQDGLKVRSPQELLDKFIGDLSFDPLKFLSLKSREQVTTLLKAFGVGYDPDDAERRRKAVYDQRTSVNVAIRELKGTLETLPKPMADTPEAEVSVGMLTDQFVKVRSLLTEATNATEAIRSRVKQITDLEAQLSKLRAEVADLEILVNELPRIQRDHDEAKAALDSAEETNRRVRDAARWQEINGDRLRRESDQRELTAQIEAIDAAKEKALAGADLPIPGLGIGDAGLTLQGIPLEQASSAEALRLSVAVGMALNPQLKVLRITDGSLLDSKSLAAIEAMAKARDFQVWIEKVDESGKVGFVIEEGRMQPQANKS